MGRTESTARSTALRVSVEDLHSLPRPNGPARLAHLVFKTPRLAEMIDWYSTVLDAVIVFRDRRVAFLTYDGEHHRVALIRLPRILRIPGAVWSLHRKVWGFDHAAFSYAGIEDLVATYRRLSDAGIEPVWCINHGPTTSMYYEDPDGNRIELQVDNFDRVEELLDWMESGEFAKNAIGVEFDPDVLERLVHAGVPRAELIRRGSAPPDGRRPRSGLRTIRWKTL
jgi:catechol-2,3-dioxygenase